MQSHRDLIVWQKSMTFVVSVYALTARFPKSELWGLVAQIRRAAVSIPANLAEGYARKHRAEYIQFVRIAFGSGAEVETHLLIAKKLRFASEKEIAALEGELTSIMKMLNRLLSSLDPKP